MRKIIVLFVLFVLLATAQAQAGALARKTHQKEEMGFELW